MPTTTNYGSGYDGFDLNQFNDLPPVEKTQRQNTARAEAPQKHATAPAARQEDAGYKYTPSEDTLKKLDEIPSNFLKEMKDELGIDIEKMKNTTERYGILEAIAYGGFTQHPLPLRVKAGHGKVMRLRATLRLWTLKDGETGEMKWGYEFHPVKIVNKLDKDGRPMYKENGEPIMTYDRNRLTGSSVIEIGGRLLNSDQIDHLRLTGNLGEAITSINYRNEAVQTVYSVDPYNQHELIGVDVSSLKRRLDKQDTFKYVDRKNDVKTEHQVKLDDGLRARLSIGQGVWAKNESEENVYIQYNVASGRLERGISYEMARRNEIKARNEKAQKEAAVKQAMEIKNPQPSVGTVGIGQPL